MANTISMNVHHVKALRVSAPHRIDVPHTAYAADIEIEQEDGATLTITVYADEFAALLAE